MDRLNSISEKIIGAAIAVHKELGPGLLETVYEVCLLKEMEQRGIEVSRQVDLPLYYKGQETGKNFRIDILVENEVIVELKSVEEISPLHEAQLLTYLKLTQKKLGLLINFNVPFLKHGIVRRVL
ncbi:MAG: GxxExxY protein [Bacteroidaceae bacterium]|nr:GxxExxY protein [Bacteroidaceae bacterium]